MRRLATLLILAAPLLGQQVPVLTEATPGFWDLWAVDEAGAGKQLVAGPVEILPITLTGRAPIDRLRADLPQQGGDGAPRLVLPDGGVLVRTRGNGATHLRAFDASGAPALVASAPDGAAGAGLLAATAVSPDGTRALALAPDPLGGATVDVLLGDTAGGPPVVLATGLAEVAPASLRVSGERAFLVAGGELLRADLTSPAPSAQPVDLGLAAGEVVEPGIVVSADGLTAAVTSERLDERRVHVVDAGGAASCITPVAGPFDPAGLEALDGPWLALSPDGARVAYRASSLQSDVLVSPVPQPDPEILTGDADFVDTIDNAGVLAFVGPFTLTFVAGETALDGAVDSADVFEAAIDPLGGEVTTTNVTATSGFTSPPFLDPGELEVLDVALSPDGARWLVTHDPAGGDAALGALPVAAGAPTPLEDLLGPLVAPPTLVGLPDAVLVDAVADLDTTSERRLVLLRPGQPPALLGAVPPAVAVSRVAASADGAKAAFVVSAGPAAELAVRLDVATTALELPWPLVGQVSAGLALSPGGRLVLGVGPGGDTFAFVALDAPLSGSKLPLPVGDGLPIGR